MQIVIDRVTEIALVESGGKRTFSGTGYLIGPGLILTAGHVVFHVGRPIPHGINISVRTVGDRDALDRKLPDDDPSDPNWKERRAQALEDKGGAWRTAQLIWPPPGTTDAKWDLAILSVERDGDQDTYHGVEAIAMTRIGRLSERIRCNTCGYPLWRQEVVGTMEIQRARAFTGNVPPSDSNTDRDFPIDDAAPYSGDEWKGLSGGPVCPDDDTTSAGSALIGVVARTDTSEGNNLLSITLLPSYLSNKGAVDPYGFWRAAGRLDQAERAAGGLKPAPAPAGNKHGEYAHIVDRRPHDGNIEDGCDARYRDGSSRPAIVLFHGREQFDDPSRYPARWRSGDLEYKKLTGNVVQSMNGNLSWPAGAGAREPRLRRLKGELIKSLVAAPGAAAANPDQNLTQDDPAAAFQRFFAAGRLPRTLSIYVRPVQMQPADLEVLADFLAFFAEAAAGTEVVTLFLALVYLADPGAPPFVDITPDCVPRSAAAAQAWSRLKDCVARHDKLLHVWDVGALTQIDSLEDLEDWRGRLERKNIRPPEYFFTNLSAAISKEISVPLTTFSQLIAPPPGAP